MEDRPTLDADQIVASAVQYLVEGGEMEVAQLLLYCDAEHVSVTGEYNHPSPHLGLIVGLRGPRMVIDKFEEDGDWGWGRAHDAIKNTLPWGYDLDRLQIRASTHVPDANWRSDLQELIKSLRQ